jgi:hypothetical protein
VTATDLEPDACSMSSDVRGWGERAGCAVLSLPGGMVGEHACGAIGDG